MGSTPSYWPPDFAPGVPPQSPLTADNQFGPPRDTTKESNRNAFSHDLADSQLAGLGTRYSALQTGPNFRYLRVSNFASLPIYVTVRDPGSLPSPPDGAGGGATQAAWINFLSQINLVVMPGRRRIFDYGGVAQRAVYVFTLVAPPSGPQIVQFETDTEQFNDRLELEQAGPWSLVASVGAGASPNINIASVPPGSTALVVMMNGSDWNLVSSLQYNWTPPLPIGVSAAPLGRSYRQPFQRAPVNAEVAPFPIAIVDVGTHNLTFTTTASLIGVQVWAVNQQAARFPFLGSLGEPLIVGADMGWVNALPQLARAPGTYYQGVVIGGFPNQVGPGLKAVCRVSAATAGITGVQLTVFERPSWLTSGIAEWRQLIQGPNLATLRTDYLSVHPGLPAVANQSANDMVGPAADVQLVITGGGPDTATTRVDLAFLP